MIHFRLSRGASPGKDILPAGHPAPLPHRARRGQTMVEFALTLPILLLLIFGIVEFGRIFQAWVTIQNAARTAARFAITGAYDQTMFPSDLNNDPSRVTWFGASDIFPSGGSAFANTKHTIECNNVPAGVYSLPAAIGGDLQSMNLFAPDTTNNTAEFQSHWDGIVCDPGNQIDQGLQKDIPRLASIARQAQIGASGLSVNPTIDIPGTGIMSETPDAAGAATKPGWFHVFVCSTRPQFAANSNADPTQARYTDHSLDPTPPYGIPTCEIKEPDPTTQPGNYPGINRPNGQGRNQYDAGGPGDFVHIIVYFNHPLITPISYNALPGATNGPIDQTDANQGYLQLQASRTMINEAFRYNTNVILPGGQYATFTPTNYISPTYTNTPGPTATNSPTPTFTLTATVNTPTPTDFPTCANLSISGGSLGPDFLQLVVRNNNAAPVYITDSTIDWSPNAVSQNSLMFLDTMAVLGQTPFWDYSTLQPSAAPGQGTGTYTLPSNMTTTNGWQTTGAPDSKLQISSGSTPVQVTFGLTTSSNLNTALTLADFGGSSITFTLVAAAVPTPGSGTPSGGQTCTKSLSQATPTPNTTPTVTPSGSPSCSASNYNLSFLAFQNFGVVQFQFTNNTSAPVYISGFNIIWGNYSGLRLTEVDLNGTSPFVQPPAVPLWTGSSNSSPTSSASGTWHTNGSVGPSATPNLWVDFGGTTGFVPGQGPDFNGTTVTLTNGCTVTVQASATVLPSVTATPTATTSPTNTQTPTKTLTPTKTQTNPPTQTYTPSITLTPTQTYTPSLTNTPTNTLTPSKTPTPTQTFTPSKTNTPTNTPTNTLTPSKTDTPTQTYTPSKTDTPTQTYTPSKTNTPTSTYTPSNTNTATFTPSRTPTYTPSNTATATYTPSKTDTPSNTPTKTNTPTQTSTPTKTLTPVPTNTPTKTNTPTNTYTPQPSNTPTPTFTFTPLPTWTISGGGGD